MKILVVLATLCGSVFGGPQVPHPHGSAGADIGGSSDNAHAPRIAQSLSNIYDILGDRAEGLLECQFPFTYKGKTYTQCTTDHDFYGMYWCSTRTNARNEHAFNEWRHCQVSDGTGPVVETTTLCEQGKGTCQNNTAPCRGRTRDSLCNVSWKTCCFEEPLGCNLDGVSYRNGDYNEKTCLKVICINGEWRATGELRKGREDCGQCKVDGDPCIWTFDNTRSDQFRRRYLFGGKGNFVITQNTLKTPTFGVTADFKTCNTKRGTNHTCLHSVRYHEQGRSIELVLPKYEDSTTYPPFCSDATNVKEERCQIKVIIDKTEVVLGKSVAQVQATMGDVLLFKHHPIDDNDDLLCVNVIGSQGLSVSLCEREHSYANLYVLAMPSLKKDPKSELYGLCNTYTGLTQNGYTTYSGALTTDVTIFGDSWVPSCVRAGGTCQKKQDNCSGYISSNITCGAGTTSDQVCCIPGAQSAALPKLPHIQCTSREGFLLGDQCFIMYTDQRLPWTDAQSKCHQEGYQMAQIRDGLAITLRNSIHQRYAQRGHIWLGAKRGAGSVFRWNDGLGSANISSSSSLWIPGYGPAKNADTGNPEDCLEMNQVAAEPYAAVNCAAHNYALCEMQ